MQKNIAFFDFDGTITTKDSMLSLAEFHSGKLNFLWKMICISPSLIAMKAGFINAQTAKEIFLKKFFGGMTVARFAGLCRNFSETILPGLIKKNAMEAIADHLINGTTVVIVSASAENWLEHWCKKNNLLLLCTRLEVKDEVITGKISGINCNAKEKVSRINAVFNLADFTHIYVYGDSSGDKEMLSLATHPYYRIFY